MSSWWPQWLSGAINLPAFSGINLSLPSNLQAKFLSFVLRRSLGRFLRPGQLDAERIDSQIGSGYVQINGLELDEHAVNDMLDGLPLRLQSGSIGSVIVRIPWPNLLTSKLGLSLKSVHVALELVESSESAPSADLAESLASLSESFVHDELGQEEEEDLLRSMHSGSVDEGHLPGGFQDPATAGPSVGHMQSDEAGMFSALVERLVARFSLDASDIRITIAKPDITRFTFHVADIRYGQDAKAESSEDRDSIVDGQQPREPSFTQSLSIYGFQLSMASLRLISSSSETQSSSNPSRIAGPSSATTAARHEHPSPSPPGSTSGSEFDDEAAAHMSQSLFFPRRGSPPEDMERSVYESAVLDPLVPSPVEDLTQEVVPAVNMPPDDPAELSHPESGHVILSLPEPIQATISLHYRRDGSSDESVQGPYSRRLLSISISLGIIPLALKSAHIRDLLEVTSFASAQSTTAPQSRREASSVPSVLKPRVEFNGHVRGVAIILLPEDVLDDTDSIHPVSDFFLHPQHVPAIQPVFTRLFVDGIDLSFTQHTQAAKFGSLSKVARHEVVTAISVEVVDASLLCFYETGSPSSYVQPIFITDTNLSQQYSPYHHHPPLPGSGGDIESRKLPSFDVIDWADPARRTSSAKLSTWRVRPSPPSHQRSGFGLSNVGLSTSPPTNVGLDMHMMHRIHGGLSPTQRAISASMHASTSFAASMISESTSITMSILPVHVFIDLGVVEDSTAAGQDSRLLAFIDGCLGDIPSITQPPDDFTAPPLAESQQLRKRALNDLDLKYDYDQPPVRDADNLKSSMEMSTISIKVMLPMLRIQIRSPPPPSKVPRSGAIVIDLHNIEARINPSGSSQARRAHFTVPEPAHESSQASAQDSDDLVVICSSRILVSYSSYQQRHATGIVSLGPGSFVSTEETPAHPLFEHEDLPLRQLLRINLKQPKVGATRQQTRRTVVTVYLPSITATLAKPLVDGLQFFADDVSQLAARLMGGALPQTPQQVDSYEQSLIGSRFFARYGSRSASISDIDPSSISENLRSETVMKLDISQVCLGLLLPRSEEMFEPRLLAIFAVKIDTLVEMKPDGKDETVVTLSVENILVHDSAKLGSSYGPLPLLQCTVDAASMQSPVKVRFTARTVPETTAKESVIKVTLLGLLCNVTRDSAWAKDLGVFFKAPPEAFDDVVPSERTRVSIKVQESAIRVVGVDKPVCLLLYVGALDLLTDLVDSTSDSSITLELPLLQVLLTEDHTSAFEASTSTKETSAESADGLRAWKGRGYATLAEVDSIQVTVDQIKTIGAQGTRVQVKQGNINLHLCADTAVAISTLSTELSPPKLEADIASARRLRQMPTVVSFEEGGTDDRLFESVDDLTFRKILPEVGPTPDLIEDDLPSNPEYIDDSYGTAGGFRALNEDEEDEEFDIPDATERGGGENVTVLAGGETIRLLTSEPIRVVEHHFDTIPPDTTQLDVPLGETAFRFRLQDCHLAVFLHEGYDWPSTRRTIEEETKSMRRKLMKIRQMLASGQTPEPTDDDTSALLFNSIYVGLDENVEGMDSGALIAAIDQELEDEYEVASQSSWQTLVPASSVKTSEATEPRAKRRRLKRSRSPSIEFRLAGLAVSFDQYRPSESFASRTLVTVQDLQILDHIKTSTWKMFLTELRKDLRGVVRETGSNMVRLELRNVRPIPGNTSEESRLRAKLLPLRLHVDQDALDFLKKFFSFKDPGAAAPPDDPESGDNTYFQHVEIFPVDIKLDYKPRRVDYRALKEGKTIELMNFFHFDGSEMTLRHIRLNGVTGWARVGDMLNDLWTPDVTATQLVDVISGVAPIRSVVNVGSGVADLVLLPIAQYKKDGRIVRGMQKGSMAFMKSTGMEALKLGARLATGTQVILEQAETLFGAQFKEGITAEAVNVEPSELGAEQEAALEDALEEHEQYSRYSEQPLDAAQGIQSAYKSLKRNFNTAAQTILAVPMEVYERSGTEGPVRAVVRAVPIAVLKPMIGASEAVSKTLLGIHNTFESDAAQQAEAKYKQR